MVNKWWFPKQITLIKIYDGNFKTCQEQHTNKYTEQQIKIKINVESINTSLNHVNVPNKVSQVNTKNIDYKPIESECTSVLKLLKDNVSARLDVLTNEFLPD